MFSACREAMRPQPIRAKLYIAVPNVLFKQQQKSPASARLFVFVRTINLKVLINAGVFGAGIPAFKKTYIHLAKAPVKVQAHDLWIAAAHHILNNVLRFGM